MRLGLFTDSKEVNNKQNCHRCLGVHSIRVIVSHSLIGMCCLYLGIMIGMTSSSSRPSTGENSASEFFQPPRFLMAQDWHSTSPRILSSTTTLLSTSSRNSEPPSLTSLNRPKEQRKPPFPASIRKLVVDFGTVPRDEFNSKLEIGVPLDDTVKGADDVLILYTSSASMPNGWGTHHAKVGLETETALENCHTVKVILQEPYNDDANQCIAIVPQWESYQVHKFMRLPKEEDVAVDLKYPLRYVSRLHSEKGQYGKVPKLKTHTMPSYELLVVYLQNLNRILQDLQPFLKKIIDQSHNPSSNTLVVLACNKGQSILFHNFVCNARAKGLDLSHVVLFATDEDTLHLSQELGIPAWYDAMIFGDMPEEAARSYGDRTFAKMMMAKVYCVHLVLQSGYNVLYHDVDIIWLRNPLSFFDTLKETKELEEWDMFFQDDGSRHRRYSPYSPNTGTIYL
jgi:hypothetical protein